MMQKHKCLIDFILTVASQIAYADLPLSLEELLTDKGKFKLESSISYINTERNQSEFANPIYVQTKRNENCNCNGYDDYTCNGAKFRQPSF